MISQYNKILIVGNLNLDQMLPKNVANMAPLIQTLICLSVHNIIEYIMEYIIYMEYMGEYWILYLILPIIILLQFYLHHAVIILLFF